MAEKNKDNTPSDQSSASVNNSFLKGMAKDYNDTFVGEGVWTHARNAVNNSHDGQIGTIGNEPSNLKCVDIPYTVIGVTHTFDDKWVIFSTDDIDSEIGEFDESNCSYRTIVNARCLNFKRSNLITATSRAKYDCGTLIYWDDGLNPTRSMDIENVPWIQNCTPNPPQPNVCTICVDTTQLNCEKIRIAPFIKHPCINIARSIAAGTLPNGSYQACIAYTVNQLKVTDYIGLSEVQGLFTHENVSSALTITITNIDTSFDEFELVLLTNINAQTVARRIGYYATSQGTIYVDRWSEEYEDVSLSDIILRTEPIEKSDALYSVGDYLLRTGVYSKFKFNYQPLANRIRAKWVCVEYPNDYYIKSNNNIGYMRDEQYAFFIRFVYNTGEFSDSYHIPGRPSVPSDLTSIAAGGDAFDGPLPTWKVYNTASVTTAPSFSQATPDGGVIIAKGDMAYWESTERYPDEQPDIWNSFPTNPNDPLNLCNKPIRHHKMPDETVPNMPGIFNNGGSKIRLLGVEFENIAIPVDLQGNPIASIVGYQILRGSREGNKSIIAKGLINNMRNYSIPGTSRQGLYQNYPYNDLRDDFFLTGTFQGSTSGPKFIDFVNMPPPLSGFRDNIFSFHSPDTSFSNPFLNPYDVKFYTSYGGKAVGQFQEPYRHPKHKFMSNLSVYLIDALATIIAAKRISQLSQSSASSGAAGEDSHQAPFEFTLGGDDLNVSQNMIFRPKEHSYYHHQKEMEIKGNAHSGGGGTVTANAVALGSAATATANLNPRSGGEISQPGKAEAFGSDIGGSSAGVADDEDMIAKYADARVKRIESVGKDNYEIWNKTLPSGSLGGIFGALTGIIGGVLLEQSLQQQLYKLILNLIPYQQYALQYNSYGFYNFNAAAKSVGQRRRRVDNAYYVGPTIQQYDQNFQINNLNRSRIVVFGTTAGIAPPAYTDNSRVTKSRNATSRPLASIIIANGLINLTPSGSYDINEEFFTDISGHYGALKIAFGSQYGQLQSIKQIPISNCIHPITPAANTTPVSTASSGVLWNGDIYVNRFTEKNSMFFFNNWLMGEPEGTDIDYTNYHNIPYARFWINSKNLNNRFWQSASRYRQLDDCPLLSTGNVFFIKEGWFYLFNSGVRDFFVESEVNTAYRDWEDDLPKRHYDPYRYTDVSLMFRSDMITSGNYYKYDYSLSVSRLVGSHISWGNVLPRDYDPLIANTCYTYKPNEVIYSLPLKDETPKQDSWSIFRTNNKKDFIQPVSSIKSINKTGAIFMMKNSSPLAFMGVEELKLDATGAKVTIGDGRLFESGQNQLQSLVNTEDSFEYGSNQSRFSAINTTYGLFWISQAAGKVFNYGGSGLEEISKSGMRWWFAKYLPSELLKSFPNYALYDNPVAGIGTQVNFDSTFEILYLTKKDYKPKFPIGKNANQINLDTDNKTFRFNGTRIQLTDSTYFENASWTISYDPKLKAWLSFHDWKPTFMILGRRNFMTVNDKGIWKHNVLCNSYCNFYGTSYPFEVEFVSSTGQSVATMRSIEYLLETYTHHNDCRDKFHVLDQNFDQAIIYNSEQISGVLQLVLKGKNNPLGMLTYPQINPNSISIQYSKEENKYRFNQFWDITKNRGEFPPGFNLPMFTTAANGYEYPINPQYVNYQKPILERKKFRHHVNKVFLRRVNSDQYKFIFKVSNQKILQSPR